MQQGQRVGTGVRARRFGEVDNGGVRHGQRGLAQIERRRKTFDRAVDDAVSVLGVDFAGDRHRQFVERAFGIEDVADIAEGAFLLMQLAILRYLDTPIDHVLAVMIARGQAQNLRDAFRRRLVAVAGGVGNANAHWSACL